MKIPAILQSAYSMANEKVLIDSGVTANFLDQRVAKQLGFKPKGQSHGKGSGGAVPMVIDPPGWINRTLTEEEKTTMMKEGRCFRCGNKGHMSKACPTRPVPSSTPNTPKNKPQHARATKVEEVDKEDDDEPKAKLGVDQVINSIHTMTEEECEDFLTKAFAQKDF